MGLWFFFQAVYLFDINIRLVSYIPLYFLNSNHHYVQKQDITPIDLSKPNTALNGSRKKGAAVSLDEYFNDMVEACRSNPSMDSKALKEAIPSLKNVSGHLLRPWINKAVSAAKEGIY
jgi:hypothetical protein